MSHTKSSTVPVSQTLPPKKRALHERPGIRQFVKFCTVGAGSTIINFGVTNILYRHVHLQLVPSLTIAFFMSTLNGFFWNRRWTFRDRRGNSAATQSLRFFAVNIVGWLLNTSIVVVIVASFQSHGSLAGHTHFMQIVKADVTGQGKQKVGAELLDFALFVATCVVVFWNFFANRLWTFRHKKLD